MGAKYRRVLIKLSGEALSGERTHTREEDGKTILEKEKILLEIPFIDRVAQVIGRCIKEGVQIAVIVGAGNIWRGRQGTDMDRCRADHMGMLATTINALALQDGFLRAGVDAVVMSPVGPEAFVERYTSRDAIAALKSNKVVILAGGLGIPCFSTDTAAALRAAEIGADCILMAKNIDGVYDDDPEKNKKAKRYDDLTYEKMIADKLHALDLSSAIFCQENDLNGYAFALKDPENIYRAIMGEAVGTAIHN